MKILLDCGFNAGKFTSRVIESYDLVYAFDIDPDLKKNAIALEEKYQGKLKYIESAVWINNGTTWFTRGKDSTCNSLISDKKHLKKDERLEVKTIDFSQFITEHCTKKDEVTLKMDIEGAEYPLLNHLILKNTINLISVAHIEFHHSQMESKELRQSYRRETSRIIEELKNRKIRYIHHR